MHLFNKFRIHTGISLMGIFGVLSLTSLPSCSLFDKEEAIPSYIHIDTITVTSSLETQGFPSAKIIDAWVYVNGIFVGAFELPTSIPVLDTGEAEIIVYAGIKENGISGVSMIYPFYNAYSTTQQLTAGETLNLSPNVVYKPAAGITFSLLERFESSNAFEDNGTNVSLTTTTDPALVFEGNRSAFATMQDDIDTFRVVASNPILFPGADKQMFLELDYRCDIPFNVWVKCNTNDQPIYDEVLTVTSKESWNKIYINLNPTLQFFSQYSPESIQLEFRAINPDTAVAQIFFDNIKIIQTK
ncbi:MAG TPA: hypothetical protein PKL06_13610 [Chitinophagales bacterium]|nr:hypothetical protein [Chitinophagales bacterium]